jgi:hypothetical protein
MKVNVHMVNLKVTLKKEQLTFFLMDGKPTNKPINNYSKMSLDHCPMDMYLNINAVWTKELNVVCI